MAGWGAEAGVPMPEGVLACLIDDYRLSGIRAESDHPSLFNGHQS